MQNDDQPTPNPIPDMNPVPTATNPVSSPTPSSRSGPGRRLLSSVFGMIVFVAVAGLIRVVTTNHGNGSVSQQVQNAISSDAPKPFTSTEYNFAINFPGFPTINNQTQTVEGHNVPETIYERETNNGNTAYLAAGYDFSDFPNVVGNEKAVLEGALNGDVQALQADTKDIKSATLESSSVNTFQDLPGMSAVVTMHGYDGVDYANYIQLFIRGNKMYAVETIGTSQAEFNTFLSSFQFTQ